MRSTCRALIALVFVGAFAPRLARAQACPQGMVEDPQTGECRPAEVKKKHEHTTKQTTPSFGEPPEEKERRAKLNREYCERQCDERRVTCREDKCDQQEAICRDLCFKGYLRDLPGERADAVEAQANLKSNADARVSATKESASQMSQAVTRCAQLLSGAVHPLGDEAMRTCDRLQGVSKNVSGISAGAEKQRAAFESAKRKTDVLLAADDLDKSAAKAADLAKQGQSMLAQVQQLSDRWKRIFDRAQNAANEADLAASAADTAHSEAQQTSREATTSEAQRHVEMAATAAKAAHEAAADARKQADAAKAAATPERGEELASRAEKSAEAAKDSKSGAEHARSLEQQRVDAIHSADQQRRDAEQARINAEVRRKQEIVRAHQQAVNERESIRAAGAVWRGRAAMALVFGGAAAAGTAGFMYLGTAQNAAIKAGGFATSQDIIAAGTLGQTYNNIAIGLAITAGLSAVIGLPLLLMNPDPGPLAIGITPTSSGAVLGLSGRLP